MIDLALILFFITVGFALVLELAVWVCQAVGMRAIAKRRGVKGYAAVWDIFGIGQAYIAGAIADDYSRRAEGKTTSRRKLLLGLGIPILALTLAISALGFGMIVSTVEVVHAEDVCDCGWDGSGSISVCNNLLAISEDINGNLSVSTTLHGSLPLRDIPDAVAGIVIYSLIIALLTLLLLPLTIVYAALYYIALYKLYQSCDAKNTVLYIVLSICIPFCIPIFLLVLRGKDDSSLAQPGKCT